MINSKITKTTNQQSTEEKVIKLLESMDWKLWEMYNMMKDFTGQPKESIAKSKLTKKAVIQPKTD